MLKRIYVILPVLALLNVVLFVSACEKSGSRTGSGSKLPEVKVSKISIEDVPIPVEFEGETKGSVVASVNAEVEGTLENIAFEAGAEVEEGQPLYTINSQPYKDKLDLARSTLADAQGAQLRAEVELARVKPLVKVKAANIRALEAADQELKAAQAAVQTANAKVDLAQAELLKCQIFSPIKGVIGVSQAQVGDSVGKEPAPVVLTTVSKLDPIHVKFTVSAKELPYFSHKAQIAAERADAPENLHFELILSGDKVFSDEGSLAIVDNQLDPSSGGHNVEASFPNPTKQIKAGQIVKLRSIFDKDSKVILVDKKYLLETDGQFQAFVIDEKNELEVRNLKVGRSINNAVTIEEGLVPGDFIVVGALDNLKPGTLVSPIVQSN